MSLHHLDARRLICPMPVIKVQQKIKELSPGDQLEVICRDKGVLHDIPAWCRVHGHSIVQIEQTAHEIKIVVQVEP